MGIKFDKARASERGMICSAEIKDISQVGSIYLVVHRQAKHCKDAVCEQQDTSMGKWSHFAIAVDITGSSTADHFVATHVDLCVTSPTDCNTYVEPRLHSHTWDHYLVVRKIGQIPQMEITRFPYPALFASDLHNRLVQQVYYPLLVANGGPRWSSVLNCQTMTKSSIEFLGYQFPHDIAMITDILPTMFDLYAMERQTTAQTRGKENHSSLS